VNAMNTFLYFVRHAVSPFSPGNERNRGLSGQGKRDAVRVAAILQHEGIDVIVSSSYARAIETVKPLADVLNKEIHAFEALAERAIGSVNVDLPDDVLLRATQKSFEDLDYCLPEGETTRQARERAIPVIRQLLTDYQGRKIAVGTHGNIMTIILNYFDKNYGFDFFVQTTKPDIYKAEFDGLVLKSVERLWKP